jgi:hypothetical protein
MMAAWIGSGAIAWCIIGLTVLEVGAIAGYRRVTGGGLSLAESLPNILAGDFLLLAWVFSSRHWMVTAVCLLGSLVAHGTDMWRRWRTAG